MINTKEKTAITSSVGADERQSITKYCNNIISIEPQHQLRKQSQTFWQTCSPDLYK